VTNLTK